MLDWRRILRAASTRIRFISWVMVAYNLNSDILISEEITSSQVCR